MPFRTARSQTPIRGASSTVLDYNLCFDASGAPVRFMDLSLDAWRKKGTLNEQQKAGLDAHSLVADPLFINPEQDDYRLAARGRTFGAREREQNPAGIRRPRYSTPDKDPIRF
jgi:hypothetical protein